MIQFEWKKIFERRLNLIAMLTGYILLGVCVVMWISNSSFYDKETQTYIKGVEALHRNQQYVNQQTDMLSEEYVTQLIREIQGYGLDLESDEAYVEVIRPLGDVFWVTVKNYTDMRNTTDGNALNAVDLTEGAHFYEQRMKKIEDYLNMDFSFGNYKEIEKEYWIKKAEKTQIPFRWGCKDIMDMVWNLIAPGFYLSFVIVICVSSVFASEYESGASNLLFTTKYGKSRLIWAKVAVSLLFTVGYVVVGIVSAFCAIVFILGIQGADLPVQLWNSVIPYNLTVGQACVLHFAILLLINTAFALVLLCCSAKIRSSLATLVIGMALIIAPAFFPMSKTSGLWNHINYLFPVRAVDLETVLGAFVSYTFGGHVLSYIEMIVIVYSVICITALLLLQRCFCRK